VTAVRFSDLPTSVQPHAKATRRRMNRVGDLFITARALRDGDARAVALADARASMCDARIALAAACEDGSFELIDRNGMLPLRT
jgi:hypothetical protein